MNGLSAALPSFRRIADIPFNVYLAALDHWQLTGQDGDLRLGSGLLRGPRQRDQHSGTCQIEVLLAHERLRRPVRMRLEIESWSPSATVLELIPCQRVRPSAAYFAAGHRLLDSLTRPLPEPMAAQQRADQDYQRLAISAAKAAAQPS